MLWKWIRRWQECRTARARSLFGYFDGRRQRFADPAVIWRALLNHPEMNFAEIVPLAEQGHEPEITILTKALGEIFGVHLWDEETGEGLTVWETLDLIRQFDAYLRELKKNTSPSRMPWLLTVYGQSSSPPSPAPEPNSPSPSTSSPDESQTEEATNSPEPSPTA